MQQRDSQTTKEEAYRHHRLQGQDGRTHRQTLKTVKQVDRYRSGSMRYWWTLNNAKQVSGGTLRSGLTPRFRFLSFLALSAIFVSFLSWSLFCWIVPLFYSSRCLTRFEFCSNWTMLVATKLYTMQFYVKLKPCVIIAAWHQFDNNQIKPEIDWLIDCPAILLITCRLHSAGHEFCLNHCF